MVSCRDDGESTLWNIFNNKVGYRSAVSQNEIRWVFKDTRIQYPTLVPGKTFSITKYGIAQWIFENLLSYFSLWNQRAIPYFVIVGGVYYNQYLMLFKQAGWLECSRRQLVIVM